MSSVRSVQAAKVARVDDRFYKRREQLADKMSQKVYKKVAAAGATVTPELMHYIHDNVYNMLMSSEGNLTENQLMRLAVETRRLADAQKTSSAEKATTVSKATTAITKKSSARHASDTTDARSVAADSMATLNPIKPGELHDMANQVRGLPPLQQKRLLLKKAQGPWNDVVRKDLEEHQRILAEQREREAKQKVEQKAYLDMQVERRKLTKVEEKQLLRRQAEEEEKQRAVWHEEEVQAAQKKKQEVVALYKDLKAQREDALRKKQIEAERFRREEAERVDRLHKELKEEENEKLKQKENYQKEVKTFLDYNKQLQAAKESEKKKVVAQDIIHLREYEKKLEQQEAERRKYLQKVSERQARQYDMANARYQTWQDQLAKDEEKAKRHQDLVDRKLREEADAIANKKLKDKQKIREMVEMQIAEKEHNKELARLEAIKLKEEVARNVRLAEEKEMEGKRNAKLFALRGMQEIDRQLIEQHERRFRVQPIKVGERMDLVPRQLLA